MKQTHLTREKHQSPGGQQLPTVVLAGITVHVVSEHSVPGLGRPSYTELVSWGGRVTAPTRHASVLLQSSLLDYLKGFSLFVYVFASGLNIWSNRTLKISMNLTPLQFLSFEALIQSVCVNRVFEQRNGFVCRLLRGSQEFLLSPCSLSATALPSFSIWQRAQPSAESLRISESVLIFGREEKQLFCSYKAAVSTVVTVQCRHLA